MWIQFSLQGKYKWLKILPDLITKYNDTKHRTIRMKSNEVSTANQFQIFKRFTCESRSPKKPKFKIGDKVRLSGFYEQELLKAKYPDVYLVQKVLKKRGKQVYVKWLGFDSSHNSWIDKTEI
ncbi:uncharacterized protein LOC116417300 [Nasonia vitripennis]|uniref:Chromo domain-containing protein n=1 Tax=Nasonia vitripennis TaxID=7425 RepID=A0A7M7QDS8_NASVI|nr:uncharacterized protein LOC116417300 [Nasonia vitripennis]